MKQVTAAIAAAMIVGACGGGAGESNVAATANGAGADAANQTAAGPGGAAGPTVEQIIRGPDGMPRGMVTVTQTAQGLAVRVAASALPPGMHGVHIHAVGRCEAPDFATAGSHWNPTNKQHGTENPQGPHVGDLPNLTIAGEGNGTLEFTMPGQLRGSEQALLDGDGAALVIHASADDYRTDPSGNSGDRIACAVIGGGAD